MLKILWKMGEIAPEEQFLPLSTIFYYLILDFYVKTGIRFSLRDKRLFEITEVEMTRVDCICYCLTIYFQGFNLIDITALASYVELQKVEIPYNQLTGIFS